MNKFSLFLVFASFALISCSGDKDKPLHSDICRKKPISEECLASKWILEEVEGSEHCRSDGGAELWLKKGGDFEFKNGSVFVQANGGEKTYDDLEAWGVWELTETGIKITCNSGDCTKTDVPFNVTVDFESSKLRISNSGYPSFLGHCTENSLTFTEVFSWKSKD